MIEEIIVAGFGGQGVMSIGTVLCYGGMAEGRKVSWMPSYGPEMRGGTANCGVVISDEPIGSPVVTEPTSLIAMNEPSLDKFEDDVTPGGLIVVNSYLVRRRVRREDVEVIYVPCNELADELGNLKVANMIALGAYLEKKKTIGFESAVKALEKVLPARRHDLIPLNREALLKGASVVAG